MKTAISLLLALVLCLPLCACGGNTPDSETQDNVGNVSTDNSTDSTSTPESSDIIDNTTENVESTERDFENHPLLSKLFGTWKNQYTDDEYAPYDVLIINEDGSCNVDGVEATWDVERPYNPNMTSTLTIDIFIEGERTCGAILFSDGTIVGQTSNYGMGGWYFNASSYITVEITPENWSEYFELVETTEYITDDFGDFLRIEKAWNLVLKNGYQFPEGLNQEISFEVQYSKYSVNCEINHDTKEVTAIGEPQNITEHTEKVTLDNHSSDSGVTIWAGDIVDTSTSQVCISDFQILRVAGDTTLDLEIEAE